MQNFVDPTEPKQILPGVDPGAVQKRERLPPPEIELPIKEKELNLPEVADVDDRVAEDGVDEEPEVESRGSVVAMARPCQSSSSSEGRRATERLDILKEAFTIGVERQE
jgi:hypothetical protein